MGFEITDQTHRWTITVPKENILAPITTGFPGRFTGGHDQLRWQPHKRRKAALLP